MSTAKKVGQTANAVAKREGKKSQARIGDTRESFKELCKLDAEYMVANPGLTDSPLDEMKKYANELADKEREKIRKKQEREAKKLAKNGLYGTAPMPTDRLVEEDQPVEFEDRAEAMDGDDEDEGYF